MSHHDVTVTPHRQGYYPCFFSCAPFVHHRCWWSGQRWELNGRPLDMADMVMWLG
jgi:hypothetical protein